MLKLEGKLGDHSRPWTLYVDGSSTSETSGVSVILISTKGFKVQQAIKFAFQAINNEVE